jgi:hypothetical protein
MKTKITGYFIKGRAIVPFLMFSLLLAGFVISSFHDHHNDTAPDNCPFCNFQTSYSAVTVAQTPDTPIFQNPLLGQLASNNENVTDPSQKLVYTSHSPPQYS